MKGIGVFPVPLGISVSTERKAILAMLGRLY